MKDLKDKFKQNRDKINYEFKGYNQEFNDEHKNRSNYHTTWQAQDDPWKNHGVIGYDMELVEKRHKELLSMALAIVKK